MAEETLLRDRIEIERLRDSFERLDRINAVEKDNIVLATRFNDHLRRFEDALARAVSPEDLRRLKDDMETFVNTSLGQLNAQQSRDILTEVRGMLSDQNSKAKDEQLEALRTVLAERRHTGSRWLWWLLGIVGGLFVAIGSTLFGVWVALSFAAPH